LEKVGEGGEGGNNSFFKNYKIISYLQQGWRRWEKVGEGWRRLEKVGEGWRRLEKVGEGGRRLEKVGEGWRRWEKVGEGWRRWEKVEKVETTFFFNNRTTVNSQQFWNTETPRAERRETCKHVAERTREEPTESGRRYDETSGSAFSS
jgi:hypothetical protein